MHMVQLQADISHTPSLCRALEPRLTVSCAVGAHDRVVANAERRPVQPATGAGARLRGFQGLLPGFALRPQAVLAD